MVSYCPLDIRFVLWVVIVGDDGGAFAMDAVVETVKANGFAVAAAVAVIVVLAMTMGGQKKVEKPQGKKGKGGGAKKAAPAAPAADSSSAKPSVMRGA